MNVNSAIIEVVIGLVFVYCLLSLMVTQVNAVIVNVLNLRAKHLKNGLEDLITDPVVRAKILAHPLVRLIEPSVMPEKPVSEQSAEQITAKGKLTKVSYIAPNTFVDVLTDILTAESGKKLYAKLYDAVKALQNTIIKSHFRELIRQFQLTGTGLQKLQQAVDGLSDDNVKLEMQQALDWFEAALENYRLESGELIPLYVGIRQVKEPAFQRALEAVLSSAVVNSLEDAEAKLAEWFNNSMTTVSEAFTRRMQFYSLLVGFLLALILNVDTLNLATTLWNDPALRQAVAVAAQQSAERAQDADIAEPDTTKSEVLTESAQRAQGTVEELLALRLPIGWEFTPTASSDNESGAVVELNPYGDLRDLSNFLPAYNPGWLSFLFRKVVGLGVTMIAIAQGAPFWFNLLNRLARGGKTSDAQESESSG